MKGRLRYHSARQCRGFTLAEMLVATALFVLVLSALAWIGVDMSRMGGVVSTNATLQSQGRVALDLFAGDVHGSRQIMNDYTAADGTVYSSDTASCLVLAAPSYASDGTIATTADGMGNIVPAHYDYIVYHLVATPAGSPNGPYTLNRLVEADATSVRPDFADAVIARHVQSAAFTCLVDQPFRGNGVDTDFALKTEIDVAGLGQAVTVDGTPMILGAATAVYNAPATGVNIDLGSLSFATAPANNAVIDAVYPVDPTDAASPANVNEASLALTLSVVDASLGSSTPQTTAMTVTADLKNH